MLSGFSSYFFGGNSEEQLPVNLDDSVNVTTASGEHNDWVLVENPGKSRHFTNFTTCCWDLIFLRPYLVFCSNTMQYMVHKIMFRS